MCIFEDGTINLHLIDPYEKEEVKTSPGICILKQNLKPFEPEHDKTNKMTFMPSGLRSAWSSAQSDQSLRCPHEENLGP